MGIDWSEWILKKNMEHIAENLNKGNLSKDEAKPKSPFSPSRPGKGINLRPPAPTPQKGHVLHQHYSLQGESPEEHQDRVLSSLKQHFPHLSEKRTNQLLAATYRFGDAKKPTPPPFTPKPSGYDFHHVWTNRSLDFEDYTVETVNHIFHGYLDGKPLGTFEHDENGATHAPNNSHFKGFKEHLKMNPIKTPKPQDPDFGDAYMSSWDDDTKPLGETPESIIDYYRGGWSGSDCGGLIYRDAYGISLDKWNKLTPEQRNQVHDFHEEVLSGKHPELKEKVEAVRQKAREEELLRLRTKEEKEKKTW